MLSLPQNVLTVLTFRSDLMRWMVIARRPLDHIHGPPQLCFQLFKLPALVGCHTFRIMI